MAELSDFISQSDIDAAMKGAEVQSAKVELAEQAADYWRSVSPEDSGTYIELIGVKVTADKVQVGAEDEVANIIEYGSEDTEEFAPRAKTEAHFNR